MNLPVFQPGAKARDAHRSLRSSLKVMDQARHCAVLWFADIQARKLHRELGYATMRAYAMEELGFSSTRCGDFLRLAGKINELPQLRGEMAAGRIGYSKAREIIPVADRDNEAAWVEVARTAPRAEVRRKVKQAKAAARSEATGQESLLPATDSAPPPVARTVAVHFELNAAQYAEFEALMAQVGQRGSRADLLLEMARALAADGGPPLPAETSGADSVARRRAIRPPHQVHVHRCPDCGRSAAATPRGEIELPPTAAEVVACDAEVHVPGQRNVATIPPRVRREVLARDRHTCRRKGCGHTRHLHIHHLVPRAGGGSNALENLVTLCAGCHHLWHEKGVEAQAMLEPVGGDTG